MSGFFENNRSILQRLGLFAALVGCTILFFRVLFSYVAPFIIGLLLSTLFLPFVNFGERRLRIPRWLGTLLAMVLFFGIVVSLLWSGLRQLGTEAAALWQNLPEYLEALQAAINDAEQTLHTWLQNTGIFSLLRPQPPDFLEILLSRISSYNAEGARMVLKLPNLLMSMVFTLLSSFFFTKDQPALRDFFYSSLPSSLSEGMRFTGKKLTAALVGFLRAQAILMLFVFLICIVGFFMIGSPYAFLLSFLTAVVDALPFFGSGLILIPAAIIFLLLGNSQLALGYGIVYLVITLLRQLLQPKIIGNEVGLQPLPALFALFLGWKLLGVAGLIIGPITAVIFCALNEAIGDSV